MPKPIRMEDLDRVIKNIVKIFKNREVNLEEDDYVKLSGLFDKFDAPDYHELYSAIDRIGQKLDYKFLIFLANFKEGVLFLDVENSFEKALTAYKKAEYKWFDKLSEQLFYGNIALACLSLQQFHEAIAYLEKAIEIATTREDKASLGRYFQNKGVAHRSNEELSLALECYKNALEISNEINDGFYLVRKSNYDSILEDLARAVSGEKSFPRYHVSDVDTFLLGSIIYKRPMKIFLCHASEDKKDVMVLQQELISRSFDPWLDERKMVAGTEWKTIIRNAIENAEIFLVCITSNSNSKKTGFLYEEISMALEIINSSSNKKDLTIIPLLMEDVPVPDQINQFHAIRHYHKNGFTELVKALNKWARKKGFLISDDLRTDE